MMMTKAEHVATEVPASPGAAAEPTTGATTKSSTRGLQPLKRLATLKRFMSPKAARMTIASVGVLALAAAFVTLVLGVVGIVSFLVPLLCVAVSAASVATLRLLAVRARRARVQQAFAHAMSPVRRVEPVVRQEPSLPQRPTSLFDADASTERPLTPMELRTAALASAARPASDGTAIAGTVTESTADLLPAGATAWVPVELPKPTYVDAAKAQREAPAPLDLPEAPRASTRTPIKTSEAAVRTAAADELVTAGSGAATGRINLDDILQRRRA